MGLSTTPCFVIVGQENPESKEAAVILATSKFYKTMLVYSQRGGGGGAQGRGGALCPSLFKHEQGSAVQRALKWRLVVTGDFFVRPVM